MKKLVVLFVVICAVTGFNSVWGGGFTHSLNLAIDAAVSDGHDFTVSGSTLEYDVNTGFSLIYEGHKHITDTFDFGFGLEFMFPRELDVTGTEAAFNFAPLYMSLVFHTDRYNDYVPFFGIQAGYNLVYDGNDDYKGSGDLTGGLYYGAGFGVLFSRSTRLEFRWSRYEGVYDTGFGDADVSNEEYSLILGYHF